MATLLPDLNCLGRWGQQFTILTIKDRTLEGTNANMKGTKVPRNKEINDYVCNKETPWLIGIGGINSFESGKGWVENLGQKMGH